LRKDQQMRLVVLSLILIAALCGCVMNKPILLSSPMQSQASLVMNPSLSVPRKGLHPYVGASVGADKEGLFDTSYSAVGVNAYSGLLYQTSLVEKRSIGFFASLGTKLGYSSYSFSPDSDSRDILTDEQERKLDQAKTTSVAGELGLRLGTICKLGGFAMAFYGIGFTQYEQGEYYSFRREIDCQGNYYNLSNRRTTNGYGFGLDFSGGKVGKLDIGTLFEFQNYYVKTQSYVSSYVDEGGGDGGVFSAGEYVVKTEPGGESTYFSKENIGIYFDYESDRIIVFMNEHDFEIGYCHRW
jgi:hypothetical protein